MNPIQSEIDAVTEQLARTLAGADAWTPNTGTEPEVLPGYHLDVKYRRGNIVRGAGPIAAPEVDPHGKDPHAPGAKLDAGKIRPALVLGGFARALKEVAQVGTYGAQKYTENGWVLVPNGVDRYDDAMLRHWLDEHCGVELDKDTELRHAAHAAWNALARLDLLVRQSEGGAA